MRIEKADVFIAEDGQKFATEEDCLEHESKVAAAKKRVESLEVYTVSHGFDATEGRGYFGRTHIITDSELPVVLQYCINRWGNILRQWYGNSYYESWRLHSKSLTVEKALKQKGHRLQYGASPTDIVFISSGDAIDGSGLPEPTFPWPPQKKVKAA